MDDLQRLIQGVHSHPFQVLGPQPPTQDHRKQKIRAFWPAATELHIIPMNKDTAPVNMSRIDPAGVFETEVPLDVCESGYQIKAFDSRRNAVTRPDPYAFPPSLSDFDLHLLGEGKDYRAYEKLGAHLHSVNGSNGVHFVVWAPNAIRVSVVGDFNNWDGRIYPMECREDQGLWELFIPNVLEGTPYKYEIRSKQEAAPFLKADPYAFAAELRPKTASIVKSLSGYTWHDHEWLQNRAGKDPLSHPLAIYEVHLGSWNRAIKEGKRWLTYSELTQNLVPYVQELGFTHIELLPITEHPFDGSWGYQTTGYFAPTSRFGSPEDFMGFVDACHEAGVGVIMDWAPAHFPDDPHGLAWFDGTHLYDHSDPQKGYHPEWHSRIFNYGRTEVRNFLINSALFWLDCYHIDGLRVDAVASMLYLNYSRKEGEWTPNKYGGQENLEAIDFLRELNVKVHQEHPGAMMIAEESTAWPGVSRPTYVGGLGFTFKWNMGWMHDTLDYFQTDPLLRKYHQNKTTFGLMYAFSENFVLALSHDEVVHGKKSLIEKMPGDEWQRFANLRLLYGYMYAQPGKKILFMGGEIGQWREWNHEDSLDWHLLESDSSGNCPHRGLQKYVADLNRIYTSEPALYQCDCDINGFEWIDFTDNDQSVIAYIRRGHNPGDFLICVCNFTPVPRHDYQLGVPQGGIYQEVLNSDSCLYGGTNIGNGGKVSAMQKQWKSFSHSITLSLPPLAVVWLKPTD